MGEEASEQIVIGAPESGKYIHVEGGFGRDRLWIGIGDESCPDVNVQIDRQEMLQLIAAMEALLPEKKRRVSGEMRVSFNIELPAAHAHESVITDDPAVELALQVAGNHHIFLWGEDKEPAVVDFDVYEDDVEIEEDEDVD